MDNRYFRDAMGKFSTGITIVTMEENKEVIGMTVNAFMSISLEPELIAISIDRKASMYNKLKDNQKFGISILGEDQKGISMIFAKQIEKDKKISYDSLDQVPVIAESLVTLSCKVNKTTIAGDHKIIIADVTSINLSEGDPLIYYGGEYRTIK